MKQGESSELVSIIIPTLNRSKEIISCVDSVLMSDYKNIEIIVVDNNSEDNTVLKIKEKYRYNDRVILIESKKNLGAGGGRNKGAEEANGEYLLFVDSDNIIDKKMISYLIDFFKKNKNCGMVGPLMLIKNNSDTIWLYFADINMWTSQAKYKGTGEKNQGQYKEVEEVGHLPNCFMVRKDDFNKIGGFNEKYVVVYEEADLAEKIKNKFKKKIYLYSKAITYHDVNIFCDSLSFRSQSRAFLLARNRVYFIKKNSSFLQFLAFIFIFNPLIFLYYEFNLIKRGELEKAAAYFRGLISGLFM